MAASPAGAGARVPGERVPFRCPKNPREWAVVELQGQIESTEPSLSGMDLGTLTIAPDGAPELVIGNHRLRGTVAALAKPLAVCRSVLRGGARDGDDAPADGAADGDEPAVEALEVCGVVKRKYVFTKRPDPVVSDLVRAAISGAKKG